jgi:nucleoside-diphosphate-sugar epimerase
MEVKKAVLTGATGFLGYALLKELVHNDISVYAICRKDSPRLPRLDGLPNVTVIEADLRCAEQIEGITDCDVFYHLAWGGERNNFNQQYANVEIAVNCLKLAKKIGCTHFLCTGSQAEYGNVSDLITEDTPLCPTTAYGACKAAAYYLTADLAKRLDIKHTWVRVFSVYGPNDNPNTLYQTLMRDLHTKNIVYLNTDGNHIWNYLHEEDAAGALRLLGQDACLSGVYNLAGRESKPLKIYVQDLCAAVNPAAVVRYGIEKSDVHLNVSTDKIRGVIGEYEYKCAN